MKLPARWVDAICLALHLPPHRCSVMSVYSQVLGKAHILALLILLAAPPLAIAANPPYIQLPNQFLYRGEIITEARIASLRSTISCPPLNDT